MLNSCDTLISIIYLSKTNNSVQNNDIICVYKWYIVNLNYLKAKYYNYIHVGSFNVIYTSVNTYVWYVYSVVTSKCKFEDSCDWNLSIF